MVILQVRAGGWHQDFKPKMVAEGRAERHRDLIFARSELQRRYVFIGKLGSLLTEIFGRVHHPIAGLGFELAASFGPSSFIQSINLLSFAVTTYCNSPRSLALAYTLLHSNSNANVAAK